jgi:outer membrane PBP1 activator LpoA protein
MLKDEHHDHARVSTARALELLSPQQTDANLIGAAYFALSRDMEAAIAALKLRPDDAQAAALLAHWHLITGTR